jgi:hypothetical protein
MVLVSINSGGDIDVISGGVRVSVMKWLEIPMLSSKMILLRSKKFVSSQFLIINLKVHLLVYQTWNVCISNSLTRYRNGFHTSIC